MLPFCWFFIALIKHYGMALVNIHGIEPPQRPHDLQAIAQNQALVAYALLSQDCHMVPPVSLVKGARLWREESTGCRAAALLG